MWKRVAVATAVVLASVHVQAADEPILYPPQGIDSRVFIDGSTISDSRVAIWTPYNFGGDKVWEQEQIERLAKWVCGLYERRVAYVNIAPRPIACDEMGPAAERSSDCFHVHEFACVPRK